MNKVTQMSGNKKPVRLSKKTVCRSFDPLFINTLFQGLRLKIEAPIRRLPTSRMRKIKKMILAIDAAPEAISVKPKIAAIMAITKKIMDHLSIRFTF